MDNFLKKSEKREKQHELNVFKKCMICRQMVTGFHHQLAKKPFPCSVDMKIPELKVRVQW